MKVVLQQSDHVGDLVAFPAREEFRPDSMFGDSLWFEGDCRGMSSHMPKEGKTSPCALFVGFTAARFGLGMVVSGVNTALKKCLDGVSERGC